MDEKRDAWEAQVLDELQMAETARRPLTFSGMFFVAFCAFTSLLLALYASEEGCGSTDGSFRISDPGAKPSEFCDATQFPGIPDSASSAGLVAVLYFGPTVIAGLGLWLNQRTTDPRPWRWSVGVALALLLVTGLLSLGGATVEYEGLV